MLDLITPAYAQAAPAGGDPVMANILFMGVLFAIFYFLLIRPQQKQAKEHKEMISNLRRGDAVVTGGGMMGRVHRVEDDVVVLDVADIEIAPRQYKSVRLKFRRQTIQQVTAKAGGDANAKSDKLDKADKSDKSDK
ncbi:preprotein translocase subunit YajC [Magnetococcales bacterium HHB-1]